MSFGKAFGFSLLAFIGINVGFFFLGYGISGTLMTFFQGLATSPLSIFAIFLGPVYGGIAAAFPFTMTGLFTGWVTVGIPFDVGTMFLFIGYILAPLLAAFLSGRFGESKLEGFFGWFTTVMICALMFMTIELIRIIPLGAPLDFVVSVITFSIAIGLVYGLAFGSIALLTGREF